MTHDAIQQMKWWGWGDSNKEFSIDEKPYLWPYIIKACGLDAITGKTTVPKYFSDIVLPEQLLQHDFIEAINKHLKSDQVSLDKHDRLVHTYGKSFRDLWRMRNGIIEAAPDMVCYPETEDDVLKIMAAAKKHHVIIIPFGGGSNIVGCLEVLHKRDRMAVSLDLKRMHKILHVDSHSMTAKIQAGARGPELEAALNQHGMTLGHFPDSFEYSTLGGWIATRSAGMKSDKYGKIEDMVVSLRMVTPAGIIETRTVPKSSNGIDVNHLCIGSEGILGVITEVTMEIHAIPEKNCYFGYIFPNFDSGIAALRECATTNTFPAMARLNDHEKTMLSFAFKSKPSLLTRLMSYLIKSYMKYIKRFNLNEICLLLTGFEGDESYVKFKKNKVEAIYKRYGAVSLGQSPGRSFEKGKYDFPYLRDVVMDYGITVDVSETSTHWANLKNLYVNAQQEIHKAIQSLGSKPWCACHISHTYRTGASLYFTFGFKQMSDEVIADYSKVKHAAEDAFIKFGGTLSHHHAVGYEHMPWMADEISLTGVKALRSIKAVLDPEQIMNPGKLIPSAEMSQSNLSRDREGAGMAGAL